MKKWFCMCITAIMFMTILSGCSDKTPLPSDDCAVEVSTVAELLDAIKPDADITIKPGYYNLSEYIEEMWENGGDKWNETHKYVKLAECYDGVEIIIERADGISIKGGGTDTATVEIVTEPRYAAVVNFKDCHDIKLSSMTMGHTDTGTCAGNVINFAYCKNIELRNMDLYGCGVSGIGAYDGTNNMLVYDSIIRDCFYGPLEIYGCSGSFEFYDSVLKDNKGYCYIDDTQDMTVAFYRCDFGVKETEYFKSSNDFYKEGCTYSDDIETGHDAQLPDFENMEIVSFDRQAVADTLWVGAYAEIYENSNSFSLPRVGDDGKEKNISIKINADGTGVMNYYHERIDFTWRCDGDYTLSIELNDGSFADGTMYAEKTEGERPVWLLLSVGETAVWMHMEEL